VPALYIMPASRVPCLTGPEDGTEGARRDACTALHGKDHRMTSEWDFIGTNCRTHEFSHRTPRTLDTLCGGSQVPGAPKQTMGSNTAAPATDSGR